MCVGGAPGNYSLIIIFSTLSVALNAQVQGTMNINLLLIKSSCIRWLIMEGVSIECVISGLVPILKCQTYHGLHLQ